MASRAADLAAVASGRRLWTLGVAVVAVAAALVAVGRWERSRQIEREVRGLERIRAAVGPLEQPSLSGYRVLTAFDCLVYRRGANPFALELCIDRAGRLVEAIDRRGRTRHYPTLRSQPHASPIRLDRREVDRLLRRMGAPDR